MKIADAWKSKTVQIKSIIKRHQRFIPVFSFFGGVFWDNLTLNRIDRLSDNLIILFYLLLLGTLISLYVFEQNNLIQSTKLLKYKEWFPNGIQFLLGGLFSTYVVFYFQSASFTKTSLFLIILVLLLIANEFLSNRLNNTYLLLSLYFIAAFSFFIFILPVLTEVMNVFTFVAGGLCSLALLALLIRLFYRKGVFPSKKNVYQHSFLIGTIFILVNLFYWLNWIPPVPLSLKYAGIYHEARRQGEDYQLRYEKGRWYQFFKNSDKTFNYAEGDTVYCFVSVFAPTKLTKSIQHHWQFYSEERDIWMTTDRANYTLTGGREGGYRGYTFKKNVQPGDWRIDVVTKDDLLISRINFEIVENTKIIRKWKTILK